MYKTKQCLFEIESEMFESCNKNGVDQIKLGLIQFHFTWFGDVMSFSPFFSVYLCFNTETTSLKFFNIC